jgi:hypothetical protein
MALGTRPLHALLTPVAAALAFLGSTTLLVSPAEATGASAPILVSGPSSHTRDWAGHTDPIVFDFGHSPAQTYNVQLTRTSDNPQTLVLDAQYTYDGTAASAIGSFATAGLPVGDYLLVADPGDTVNTFTYLDGFTVVPAPAVLPSCTINPPARLSIGRGWQSIAVPVAGDCAQVPTKESMWRVVGPTGQVEGGFDYSGSQPTETWALVDTDPPGPYAIQPTGAYDYYGYEVPQNTAKTVVKYASGLALGATRSGRYVTLTAKSTRYAPMLGYRPWARTAVVFRVKRCPTCAWRSTPTVITNRRGKAVRTVRARTARYYQAFQGDATTVWGSTSRTVRR